MITITALAFVTAAHAVDPILILRGTPPLVDCAVLLTASRGDGVVELDNDQVAPLLAEAGAQALRAMRSAQTLREALPDEDPKRPGQLNEFELDDLMRPHDLGFVAGPANPDDVRDPECSPHEFAASVGRLARVREAPGRLVRAFAVHGSAAIDAHLRESAALRAQLDAVTTGDGEQAQLTELQRVVDRHYPRAFTRLGLATLGLIGAAYGADQMHLDTAGSWLAGFSAGTWSILVWRMLQYFRERRWPRYYWQRYVDAADRRLLGPFRNLLQAAEFGMTTPGARAGDRFAHVAAGTMVTRAATLALLDAVEGRELDVAALRDGRLYRQRAYTRAPDEPIEEGYFVLLDRVLFRASADGEPTLLTLVRILDGDFRSPKARGDRPAPRESGANASSPGWAPGWVPSAG